jgi:hypothetical protein
MFRRKSGVQDHPPGCLLPFFLCLDQNLHEMLKGGNSKEVRSTVLMMECNNCLFEGWNEQTANAHIERWADKSEVETQIV